MKKQFKKVVSMVLSAAMVLTLGSGSGLQSVKAADTDADAAKSATAVMKYAASDWSFSVMEAGKGTDATVTGDGTYTVAIPSGGATVKDAGVFCVDIEDLLAKVADDSKLTVSDVKVAVDGTEITVDQDKIKKGNLEKENDHYRIEIYNMYGDTSKDSPISASALSSWKDKVEVTFTIAGIDGNWKGEAAVDASTEPAATTSTEPSVSTEPTAPAITTGSTNAFLMYASGDWSFSNMEAGLATDATVNGDGTYTVSVPYTGEAEAEGAMVFCVDIQDILVKVSDPSALEVSNVKVTVDGKEIAVDQDKIKQGNIEDDNDHYRIEIYNEYGETKAASPIDVDDLSWNKELAVTFTLSGTGWTKPAVERPTTVTSGTPDKILTTKGIHAYLFYQTNQWDCRNAYETSKLNTEYGPNYIKAGGEESYDGDKFEVVDVQLDHDGEYTVSLAGIDLTNADAFNMLGISTDLDPEVYPNVTGELKKLVIDGTEVAAPADATLKNKSDGVYYTFMLANTYAQASGADEWKDPEETAPYFTSQVPMPEKSVSITFTISGLEPALQDVDAGTYAQPDNGSAVKPAPSVEPTVEPSAAPSTEPSVAPSTQPSTAPTADAEVGAKVGDTVSVGSFKLKVTKAATTKTAGTATVTGLTKAGKSAKSLNVKASVKSGDASYTVNAIAKNAFKGAKAAKITLNKNITKIPASAFANCKKLNKLTLNAKLKSVAKKAFKGCKKKITVKGTGKKANVKLLKKSGYKKFK